MIDDVDRTLRRLLLDDGPAHGQTRSLTTEYELTEDNFSFRAPDAEFRSSVGKTTINLFLADLREDREFRTQPYHDTVTDDRSASRNRTPSFLTCTYLITVWMHPSDDSQVLTEHRVLGLIASTLLIHRSIPSWAREGSLKGESLLRGQASGRASVQQLGEFWQAMGGAPRAVLNHSITLALPVGAAQQLEGPPHEHVLRVEPLPAEASAT